MLLTYQFKVSGIRWLDRLFDIYDDVCDNLIKANILWLKETKNYATEEYVRYVVSNTPIKWERKRRTAYSFLGFRCVDRIKTIIHKNTSEALRKVSKRVEYYGNDFNVFMDCVLDDISAEDVSKERLQSLILYKDALTIDRKHLLFNNGIKLNIPNAKRHIDAMDNFVCVRLVKSKNHILVGIIYTKPFERKKKTVKRCASIDLGMNNLVSLATPKGCTLFSGAFLNAYNRRFIHDRDRLISIYQSEGRPIYTKRLDRLITDRKRYIRDAFHKISKQVLNILLSERVDSIVVGYNAGWKKSIRMSTDKLELFRLIPFYDLILKIKYKCEMNGIRFYLVDESYTSKCDALAFEPIGAASSYSGYRIRRGLFQSCTGKLINADHNGALNIMRLKFGNSLVREIINNGHQLCPVKIRNPFG